MEAEGTLQSVAIGVAEDQGKKVCFSFQPRFCSAHDLSYPFLQAAGLLWKTGTLSFRALASC